VADCVIYARVSTKEQQDEGYSIPAQLKAIEEFCRREGLGPAERFIEAESAGKAGRTQFGAMLAYLEAHPEVRVVVAHKLDRLYRNFADQLRLEEQLGVRARYVMNDIPAGPQGEFVRDVMLSQAKFYLSNLSQEVKKGTREKVEQGGYAWRAPVGYLNDRDARCLVVDPVAAPLVRWAFERYASGLVSLSSLAAELSSMGLRSRTGKRVNVSALHKLLQNPVYKGLVRYKGQLYVGTHAALVSPERFQAVQDAFAPNRTKNNPKKRSYVLRDFLYCAECGCKITAGTHKGLTYYRCTHGKGKGSCDQKRYTREELLMEQVETLLARIAVPADIVEALVEEARLMDEQRDDRLAEQRSAVARALDTNKRRASALVDAMLDGLVDQDAYRLKAEELAEERCALELQAKRLESAPSVGYEQVERLAKLGAGACLDFSAGDEERKRQVLAEVVCNLQVEEGRIVSYQYKDPFATLEMSPEGVLLHPWWALEDLNL